MMGLSWSDTSSSAVSRLCRNCRHDWPGHRVSCDLGEPRVYVGDGFAGCADHEALPAVEREAESAALATERRAMRQGQREYHPWLLWASVVGAVGFWMIADLVGGWLWQRGL